MLLLKQIDCNGSSTGIVAYCQANVPGLRNHIGTILRRRVVPKKVFLLKAGHICRDIYFIRKGILRCYYLKSEMEVCSRFMKEKDLVIFIDV